MGNFYNKFKNDGTLFPLKWIFICMILFAVIGAIFGVLKVSFFEQSPSGRYAIHQECDTDNATPDEPCDAFYTKVSTLGQRQADQTRFYALLFGFGPGIGVGAFVSEMRKKKK